MEKNILSNIRTPEEFAEVMWEDLVEAARDSFYEDEVCVVEFPLYGFDADSVEKEFRRLNKHDDGSPWMSFLGDDYAEEYYSVDCAYERIASYHAIEIISFKNCDDVLMIEYSVVQREAKKWVDEDFEECTFEPIDWFGASLECDEGWMPCRWNESIPWSPDYVEDSSDDDDGVWWDSYPSEDAFWECNGI